MKYIAAFMIACFFVVATVVPAAAQHHLFTLKDPASGRSFADAVDLLGDVDRDGSPDVAVAEPYPRFGTVPGLVTVYSGADGRVLWVLRGASSSGGFGEAVSDVGDVDRDGYADMAVGAPGSQGGRGSFRVVSGRTRKTLWQRVGAIVGDELGRALANVGDLDGDGWSDIVVGATGSARGFVEAYSGKTGKRLWKVLGWKRGGRFGYALAAVGDTNKDGTPDVAVGVGMGSLTITGAWLFSGKDGKLLRFFPSVMFDKLGSSVGWIGDLNADGYNDALIGASYWGTRTPGAARVYSGKDGKLLLEVKGAADELVFGGAVGGTGDIDGDGVPDFAVGVPCAPYRWPLPCGSGRVVLISGKTGKRIATVNGRAKETAFGSVLSGPADVNRDGVDDIAVGGLKFARLLSTLPLNLSTSSHQISVANGGSQLFALRGGRANAGKVYLLLGSASGTRPGIRLPGATLPLNPDLYWLLTLAHPNTWIGMSLGVLDSKGNGTAKLGFPPKVPLLRSTVLHHAFVVLQPPGLTVTFASIPVPLLMIR